MAVLSLDDIREYRARVELARLNRSSDLIFNSSHPHAGVLIEQLFLAADAKIRILCRDMNTVVYATPAVLEAAECFLSRDGAELSILVEDSIVGGRDHPFIQRFGERHGVSIVEGIGRETGMNFMVADKLAYRFEPDGDRPVARACFNRPMTANNLAFIFDAALPAA